MIIKDMVKLTEKGLFIPREAYASFGEIEIIHTPHAIVIQPRLPSRQQIIEVLYQSGLLVDRQRLPHPQQTVSPQERTDLARKFGAGQPLSEFIIEEREESW